MWSLFTFTLLSSCKGIDNDGSPTLQCMSYLQRHYFTGGLLSDMIRYIKRKHPKEYSDFSGVTEAKATPKQQNLDNTNTDKQKFHQDTDKAKKIQRS